MHVGGQRPFDAVHGTVASVGEACIYGWRLSPIEHFQAHGDNENELVDSNALSAVDRCGRLRLLLTAGSASARIIGEGA
jgi:hypothetical protein